MRPTTADVPNQAMQRPSTKTPPMPTGPHACPVTSVTWTAKPLYLFLHRPDQNLRLERVHFPGILSRVPIRCQRPGRFINDLIYPSCLSGGPASARLRLRVLHLDSELCRRTSDPMELRTIDGCEFQDSLLFHRATVVLQKACCLSRTLSCRVWQASFGSQTPTPMKPVLERS